MYYTNYAYTSYHLYQSLFACAFYKEEGQIRSLASVLVGLYNLVDKLQISSDLYIQYIFNIEFESKS